MSKQSDHLFRNIKKNFGRTLLVPRRSIFSCENGIVTVEKYGIGIDACFGLAFAAGVPALSPFSSLRVSWVSSDVSVCVFVQSVRDHNP